MKLASTLKRFPSLVLVAVSMLLVTGSAFAQASGAASPSTGAALRGSFATTLTKALDSKKLKEGDVVVCQTSVPIRFNGALVPTGSKMTGHITQAQARSKGDSQSSLAMVFDKIEVAKGRELPMKGTLQAIAPALGGGNGPDTASMMGSGQMMSSNHGDNSTVPASGGVSLAPSNANTGPHPIVNGESQGVLGFKNIEMDKNSVITSAGKEVKLDSGTQMMVKGEIEMPVQ